MRDRPRQSGQKRKSRQLMLDAARPWKPCASTGRAGSVSNNASETIWWRPDYEGFIQRGAKKARELDLPFYALSNDDIYEIASQCCANYCSMPEGELALVPPPDMRIAKTRRGVPEGCATP
jgi:hypothetical protein